MSSMPARYSCKLSGGKSLNLNQHGKVFFFFSALFHNYNKGHRMYYIMGFKFLRDDLRYGREYVI